MPKRKTLVSELVRKTAGEVLSYLVVDCYTKDDLMRRTGQQRMTVMRAIHYLRKNGVRIFWERGSGYYIRKSERAHWRRLESMNVRDLSQPNRGWAWCLALESTR